MALAEIVKLSNYYGKNPDYVLLGGGNSSYKDEKHLYVKPSGRTLASLGEEDMVKMDLAGLCEIVGRAFEDEADLMDAINRQKAYEDYNKRPSVEAPVHAVIPYKFVMHLHPAIVNGIGCVGDGGAAAKQILQDVVVLPEMAPGHTLAQQVAQVYQTQKPKVILLENHGVFVAADDIEEIRRIYDDMMQKLFDKVQSPDFSDVNFDKERAAYVAPAVRMMLKEEAPFSIVTFVTNKTIEKYVRTEETFEEIARAFTAEHVVYLGIEALFVPWKEDIEDQYDILWREMVHYRNKHGMSPRVIAVQGLGVFVHGYSKNDVRASLKMFFDNVRVAHYAKEFGGMKPLGVETAKFISGWEIETYRKKVLSTVKESRLNEKIAIVTGSAQGFGAGIAEEMTKAGANMVIADLNGELAAAGAIRLCDLYGKDKAIAVAADVSNEESVKEMIFDTVIAYGGLDVFVNNAGIVKAGTLEEMTLNAFDLVTKVNYNAYFLGAKYASRIMKIQHRFDKGYFMDIVQVNSKSGLSGSNKNFAYAGSKFGGIGLTQSFALELIPYNIKVNAVCPGNFLEGPLWTDPEKGLFVQYLRAGKVPGAKTIEDVKRSYEAKVPMNRGCRVPDVANAIMYCIEQNYETGQAIPVTGGQNMLK